MRHYVMVFLESRFFPGTWLTDRFMREEEHERVPEIPQGLDSASHMQAMKLLKGWENTVAPSSIWTLEECLLGRVAMVTALWYADPEKSPVRMVYYQLRVVEDGR